MKTGSYKKMAQKLYDIASAQGGYFTAKQALEAGYAWSTHSYNVGAKNWEREYRGIYRLVNYPLPERPDIIAWTLWSSNRKGEPQAVCSHETALTVFDLSDVNPSKIHMTVPASFRRSGPAPKVLVLHRGTVRRDEIEERHGFRVTRPLKTIADLLAAKSVQMDHMAQAVQQAFQRGLITPHDLREAHIPPAIKQEIERLRGG